METGLSETMFGKTVPFGTMSRTNERLTGRLSLISSWRSPAAGRVYYESKASEALDNKLVKDNLGAQLLPKLQAGDPDNTGFCSRQHLLETCLLHFGIMLTTAEQECLIAEWQVMDNLTGQVDYTSLCLMATAPEERDTLKATATRTGGAAALAEAEAAA